MKDRAARGCVSEAGSWPGSQGGLATHRHRTADATVQHGKKWEEDTAGAARWQFPFTCAAFPVPLRARAVGDMGLSGQTRAAISSQEFSRKVFVRFSDDED